MWRYLLLLFRQASAWLNKNSSKSKICYKEISTRFLQIWSYVRSFCPSSPRDMLPSAAISWRTSLMNSTLNPPSSIPTSPVNRTDSGVAGLKVFLAKHRMPPSRTLPLMTFTTFFLPCLSMQACRFWRISFNDSRQEKRNSQYKGSIRHIFKRFNRFIIGTINTKFLYYASQISEKK